MGIKIMMLNERVGIKKCTFLQLVLSLLVFVSCCAEAQWTKSKCAKWQIAKPPNYETNVDLNYPYSNQLFQDELPDCSAPSRKKGGHAPCVDSRSTDRKVLDFWGEGRIVTRTGIVTGFTDSYNVNHQCQEVSNGPDTGRKIPNRIPIKEYNYNDVSLTKYIADSSFTIITIMGSPIIESTINEMLRIIKKNDSSAIIAYGYKKEDKDGFLRLLKNKLEEKKFIEDPSYHFSDKLLEPTERPVVAFTYQENQSDEL